MTQRAPPLPAVIERVRAAQRRLDDLDDCISRVTLWDVDDSVTDLSSCSREGRADAWLGGYLPRLAECAVEDPGRASARRGVCVE